MYNSQFDPIGEILKKNQLVTQDQIDEALSKQKTLKKKIGEILMAMEAISEEDLIGMLSQQINIPLADGKLLSAPPLELVRLIPEPFAREYCLIPLRKNGDALDVAMIDPENIAIVDNLRKLAKCEINPVLAGKSLIESAISKAYEAIKKSGEVDNVLSGLEFELKDDGEGRNIDLSGAKDLDDAPIVRLVNIILTEALKDRATDIHVEPGMEKIIVRYRVDGALLEAMTAPLKSHGGVVSRIKIMSRLNIAESRLPQDGRFTIKLSDREVDVRVSILPTVLGEKIVMRLLDKGVFNLSLANLGFGKEDLTIFRKCINMPYGIIIISGPTGSGKSTSLYAAVKEIKSVEDNIVTVEDPVEYRMEGISQVATNDQIGLSFGATLRSILRQDPDKVLIGEIRDRETADIAMKLALTGHLVFTTLHANDTASTITRLADIGVPSYLVGSSLVLVMSQRLVRRICEECKEPYQPTPEESELLNLPEVDKGRTFYHGKGCQKCRNTGYYGRVGIFEIMAVNKTIRKLIFNQADQEQIRQEALDQKMISLRQSALGKLFAGTTTIHEVLTTTVEEF